MKLYISVGQPPVNGYKNLNLATDRVDFNNPNSICEQSCCTEIVMYNVLSYISLQHIPSVLQVLISRIRKGGKLLMIDYDVNEVIKRYNNGLLSIADLNLVLFGTSQPSKCAILSHTDLHDIITKAGLKIKSIDLLDMTFSLIAQRV